MVEIVFLDFGVGGNQFFAVTEGFEGAEREAVVNGCFEIYQDFGLLGGFDVSAKLLMPMKTLMFSVG